MLKDIYKVMNKIHDFFFEKKEIRKLSRILEVGGGNYELLQRNKTRVNK